MYFSFYEETMFLGFWGKSVLIRNDLLPVTSSECQQETCVVVVVPSLVWLIKFHFLLFCLSMWSVLKSTSVEKLPSRYWLPSQQLRLSTCVLPCNTLSQHSVYYSSRHHGTVSVDGELEGSWAWWFQHREDSGSCSQDVGRCCSQLGLEDSLPSPLSVTVSRMPLAPMGVFR